MNDLRIEAAQLAEKMIGIIEERGWCSGVLCLIDSREDVVRGGAVCIEGAAMLALGKTDRDLAKDDDELYEWLHNQPVWRALWNADFTRPGIAYAHQWNDAQASAQPVLAWLNDRATELYR